MTLFSKQVLAPGDTQRIAPELMGSLNSRLWLYRYSHPREEWLLSIATHAEPQSGQLSLGGFRIAPEERTSITGFDPDLEAIDLAIGMEEKVYWSRVLGIAGPLARRDIKRIVGGKCVMKPTADARIGQPRDFQLLDFAVACFNDCEATAGIHVTTGQDLGHGLMSDGRTMSLDYISAGFKGSVVADTSEPTAAGNYHTLRGLLAGVGRDIASSTVAFVGCGNVGGKVLRRARADGARVIGVEISDERRAQLSAEGVEMVTPDVKDAVVSSPIDALVVNAAGGTLDSHTIDLITSNERLAIVCGSENLAMPDPSDAERLHAAHKIYCPTELGGMMGYLTAAEEFLARVEGEPLRVETLLEAARALEPACEAGARRVVESGFSVEFEEAVK